MDTAVVPARSLRLPVVPTWVNRLIVAFAIYVAFGAAWMLSGAGGSEVTFYVGLTYKLPPEIAFICIAAATARRMDAGPLRSAWWSLTAALALYFIGDFIGLVSWMLGRDPFPGPSDFLYCVFYLPLAAAALWLIRAAAMRVPWVQLLLDTTIFVVGFGAFFWYLVVEPAAMHAQLGILKEALSEAYLALDSFCLLVFGVLLLTGSANAGGWRVPLLLLTGFATMFLADIIWSLGKVRGYYVPGGVQDVLYLSCCLPMAAAGREQMRAVAITARETSRTSGALARSLPYAPMAAAFLVLIYLSRGGLGSQATLMIGVVFVLTLLLMFRQAVVLRMAEEHYASLVANASDVIMIIGAGGMVRFASPATVRTLGLKPEEITGKSLPELWGGEDGERLRSFLEEIARTPSGVVGPVELRIERAARVIEGVGSNLTDDPAVRGLALNFRDISERKVLEEKLRQLAFHDPLTLLANRNLFRDRVQHALSRAQRTGHWAAVMFLDVDNFKNINDSRGHDAGDRLLQAVAQRIVQTARSSDTVARLGGDEFGVLLEGGVGAAAAVERVADALIQSLGAPFSLDGRDVRVTASIGVAFSAVDITAKELLSNADLAMYHAKAAGKNRHVTFQPQMQKLLHERLRLEADIGRALAGEEFFLEYQPIVDLGTRTLLGVEALVRWRHPEAGVLMPASFIHVLEECGQIAALGRWVLKQACRDVCAWRDSIAGGSGLRLSVNISARHLQHGELVHDVLAALEASGFESGNLVIELTESTMMYDTEVNLERFHRLKALGVKVAIDDFGTGYSSLSYLHRFPIDILKIDRSFVNGLTSSGEGPDLARAVITLGETLGLDTVAEGIELEPQVEALLSLGCVAGQGFLFAPARSLEQLSSSSFVARRNTLWTAQTLHEQLSATGRFKALQGKRS
ncbi:MAG: EAL domain-containing protein [Gammaproteobacteria bacterium]|nr:EAL domain-containing protein [Gammaproteobacteria bacterium]MDE2261994.1 EAL domain-containing protein [Gammaproteobacteria bacterium]